MLAILLHGIFSLTRLPDGKAEGGDATEFNCGGS